jgi:DASS family divalent anion:Na+ symporter
MLSKRTLSLVATVAVGLILWMIPHPQAVPPRAWHLFALFAATILGLMLKPFPMGAVAFLGITLTALTGTLSIEESLSGFGNRVIWLIVAAFFLSRGFLKTGLGARIAYLFMRLLGRRSLGLAYGLVAADLVMAPVIPSNTARSGGILFPILRSLAAAYGSDPESGTARKIGGFLSQAAFQGTVITSAMFLTAMSGNLLVVGAAEEMGIPLSWGRWALAALLPGLVSLAAVPWLIFRLYPPEIKETPRAVQIAREELAKMGKLKTQEAVLLGTFGMLLGLWIFGRTLGIHSTTAALAGLGVLLVSGVLTWQDMLAEKGAWNTLVWFSALVMMAAHLNSLGFIPWFSRTVGQAVSGTGWLPAFLILSLVYFYSHYLFASNTAHISAMYAPFLAVALAAGTPPLLAALVLAFFSNLFSSMTHYGTGPAPVYFGSGYVPLGTWWKLGFVISLVNILIWLVLGGVWWKVLGLW